MANLALVVCHKLAMVGPKIAIPSLAETSMGMASQRTTGTAAARPRWRRTILAAALAAAALSLAAASGVAEEQKRRPAVAAPRNPALLNNRPGRVVRPLPTQRVVRPLPTQRPGLVAPNIGGRGNLTKTLPNRPVTGPTATPRFGGFRAPNRFGVGPTGPAGARFGGPQFARPGLTPGGSRLGAGSPQNFRASGAGTARFGRSQFQNRSAFAQGRGGRFAAFRFHNRANLPQYRAFYGPLPGQAGFTGVPPAGETRFRDREMVVHIGADVSQQQIQSVAARHGLTAVGSQDLNLVGRTLYRFRLTGNRPVAEVIRALEAENISATAQPNYVFKLQQDLNSARAGAPTNSPQYVVGKWRLNELHRLARGKNVLVAMIDSEVDQRHPDLTGAIVDRLEPIGREFTPQPHGTGMAGAIASRRRLMGIAPDARIVAVNAFGSDTEGTYGTTEQILKGIDYAIAKGARVLNMSFAGPRDPLIQLALKKAHDKGIVLVAAAGNAGPKSPPLFPAADPNVIAVTAIDVNDGLLAQANRGPHIAVAAPGVDVLVPAPNAQYQMTTGTSVAAAHVSGVVALMLERKPDADPEAIRNALQTSARDLGTKGYDDQFGWGLVDPLAAVQALETSLASVPPSATATAAPTPAPSPSPRPAH